MDENRITGEAKRVAGKAEGTVGDLTGDTKTQARGQRRQAEGTVENLVGQAKDAVREVAEDVTEFAQDTYEHGGAYMREGLRRAPEVSRYYRDGSRMLSREVAENPIPALLIAGVVGYALAWLAHGRR